MKYNISASRHPSFGLESLKSRQHLSLTVKIDYSHDTSGFFAAQARRDVLQAAVDAVASQVQDHFAAIVPSGGNAWNADVVNPSSGARDVFTLHNPVVPADTMIVYVGASSGRPSAELADASPCGYDFDTTGGTADWRDLVTRRGRPDVADIAGVAPATPRIGAISFCSLFDWYAGLGPTVPATQYDLYTVAEHEFGHLLGIGASQAWDAQRVGTTFTGSAATALYGGPVPADGGGAHLGQGVMIDGTECAMAPYTGNGERRVFNRLDYAVLSDLGYDVAPQPVPPQTGALTGCVYDDANANGRQDATEVGFGATAYLDTNDNGVADAGEPTAPTDPRGNYTFLRVPVGRYHLRVLDPSGAYTQFGPDAQSQYVTVVANATQKAPDYVFRRVSKAGVSGFAFDDRNANGRYDSGETKTAGKTVFLDTNNNGVLDAGERSVVSGANGAWAFAGLAAGTYHVRRVFPAGYTYSTALIDTTLAAGQSVAGLTTGSKSAATPPPANTASLTGYAFDDNNKNGKYDSGDKYTSGKTIFLDLDNDGVLDKGETSVLTDALGKFTFNGLAAGTYHVRRVFVSGYTYSTTKIDLTLTPGQAAGGLLIGTKRA